MNNQEIYRWALDKWGSQAQITMTFEEMAELQKALCKDLRKKGDWFNIAEEIADVEIMLEQMKELYHNQERVEEYKQMKIERLRKLLEET